jgi:hypothetical protein
MSNQRKNKWKSWNCKYSLGKNSRNLQGVNILQNSRILPSGKVSLFWCLWEEFFHIVVRRKCLPTGKCTPGGINFPTEKHFPTGKLFPAKKHLLYRWETLPRNMSDFTRFFWEEFLHLNMTLLEKFLGFS